MTVNEHNFELIWAVALLSETHLCAKLDQVCVKVRPPLGLVKILTLLPWFDSAILSNFKTCNKR